MPLSHIQQPLQLASGNVLKNRMAKAAMSENMSDSTHNPDFRFENLYAKWAKGGAGLLITGNVMVDRAHLGEPYNVVLDTNFQGQDGLRAWAKAATANGCCTYVQLNHPGKQSPKFLNTHPVAPSNIAYASSLKHMFNPPKELSENEILDIINKFAYAAQLAKEAGFSGVQIHAAHGYLISQFLSPLHNQRTDKWGGSLENRMRFLLEVVSAVQQQVGPRFGLAVKLNSADFQKGGFTAEEALRVVQALDSFHIDFVEISGGSYESTAMIGSAKDSTLKREAYFLDFARVFQKSVQTPVMVTGGFRTARIMEDAVSSGIDLIGMARPYCVQPDLAHQILSNTLSEIPITPKKTGVNWVDKIFPLEILWYTHQIHRMGKGKKIQPKHSAWRAVLSSACEIGLTSLRRVRAST